MPIKVVKGLIKQLSRSFINAALDRIQPIFKEAADGNADTSGGAKFHGKDIIGIPSAKFHAMTGQAENSQLVRQARADGRAFSQQVIDRPSYYGDYEKYNNFSM